jgi:hypothetical protein
MVTNPNHIHQRLRILIAVAVDKDGGKEVLQRSAAAEEKGVR